MLFPKHSLCLQISSAACLYFNRHSYVRRWSEATRYSYDCKKRQKIATRLRNLHPGITQNIHTGNGVNADALAWFTSAEIALDQAIKQKMSIHGARSSEFYKQKASRKIKLCRRCLKEMWLVLSGHAMSLHEVQNTDHDKDNNINNDANIASMATFLN